MPIITRITTQKKTHHRYNIFLTDDNKSERYGFSVDESVLINCQLRKGMEISDSMMDAIKKSDSMYQFYTLAIRYLSFRMRTKKEMEDYLTKKELDPAQITRVMDKLEEEQLVNDHQFADMFVRSRINTSTKGPAIIKQELLKKGIEGDIADAALKQFSYAIQYDKVRKLAEKKRQQKKTESYKKQLQKMQTFLQQKGYDKNVIQTVVQELPPSIDRNEEWDAIIHHGEKLKKKHTSKRTGFELRQKITEGLYRKGFSFELIQQYLERHVDDKES